MSPRKSATNVTGDGRWGGVWAKLSSNRLLGEFHSTWSSISTTKPRTRAETAVRRSVGRIPWALSRYEYRSINCAWILPRTLRRDRATPAGRPAGRTDWNHKRSVNETRRLSACLRSASQGGPACNYTIHYSGSANSRTPGVAPGLLTNPTFDPDRPTPR